MTWTLMKNVRMLGEIRARNKMVEFLLEMREILTGRRSPRPAYQQAQQEEELLFLGD